MAETKRFLHQGLFLSDFSSSLSLRSSVCRKSLMIYLELGSRQITTKRISVSLWNTNTPQVCLKSKTVPIAVEEASGTWKYTFKPDKDLLEGRHYLISE